MYLLVGHIIQDYLNCCNNMIHNVKTTHFIKVYHSLSSSAAENRRIKIIHILIINFITNITIGNNTKRQPLITLFLSLLISRGVTSYKYQYRDVPLE